MRNVDAAIIGAGPYGLSIAAHFTAYGVDHRIFGVPMQLWQTMPKGMCLKSVDFATSVYTPKKGYSFIDYCRAQGISSAEPIAVDLFIRYGLWAQKQLVPELEQTKVTHLSQANGGFEVTLETGEKFSARRVVMATGLTNFARLPGVLEKLPPGFAGHTSKHQDYQEFKGKEVVVVGGGQSALESAVLLHENGAKVLIVVRSYGAFCAAAPMPKPGLIHRLRTPNSVLGHGRLNFLLDRFPFGVHYLPDDRRIKLTRKHLGPIGAWWLAPRFEGSVPILSRTEIVNAEPRNGRLALTLRNLSGGSEQERVVDYVVAGTGYEPDIDRIGFLDPVLSQRIVRIERAPRLNANFESSVPGLYFVGASAAFSFGPLFRFVCGADYSSRVVSKAVVRSLSRSRISVMGNMPRPEMA
jgi:cation diffusion facilitator CzcD-associated flavoprotein CzcO